MATSEDVEEFGKRITKRYSDLELKANYNHVIIDTKKAAEILRTSRDTIYRYSKEIGQIDNIPGADHKFYLGDVLVLGRDNCAGFKALKNQLKNKL